jgi:hypothetical protein
VGATAVELSVGSPFANVVDELAGEPRLAVLVGDPPVPAVDEPVKVGLGRAPIPAEVLCTPGQASMQVNKALAALWSVRSAG